MLEGVDGGLRVPLVPGQAVGLSQAGSVTLGVVSLASSMTRRAAAGESLDGLVPSAVAALIAELGLYRGSQAMHNAPG